MTDEANQAITRESLDEQHPLGEYTISILPKCAVHVGDDEGNYLGAPCHFLFELPGPCLADKERWPDHVCFHVWERYCKPWEPLFTTGTYGSFPLGARLLRTRLDELTPYWDEQCDRLVQRSELLGFRDNEEAYFGFEAEIVPGTRVLTFFLVDWDPPQYFHSQQLEVHSLLKGDAEALDRRAETLRPEARKRASNAQHVQRRREWAIHNNFVHWGLGGERGTARRTGRPGDVVFRISGGRSIDSPDVADFVADARRFWSQFGEQIEINRGGAPKKHEISVEHLAEAHRSVVDNQSGSYSENKVIAAYLDLLAERHPDIEPASERTVRRAIEGLDKRGLWPPALTRKAKRPPK
jgi:hypothetical protein